MAKTTQQSPATEQHSYLDMDLLRFTTAGSVDDGKSTLIGRLLFDSKSIFEDQYEAVKATSKKRGDAYLNLALFTDGLRAEREQGITIDVAYRYFATPNRKFIIADTPGHIQYTRNMVTGASTADAAIILIDVRKGVIEQTKRHTYIASLLRIEHIIICVNKMDLAEYKEDDFQKVRKEFEVVAQKLNISNFHFIPISALQGDNVVTPSKKMKWYKGKTLLELLETVNPAEAEKNDIARFPVQYVIRPINTEFHDYRSYAGRIAAGIFKKGDNVTVLPNGNATKIKSIDFGSASLQEAFAPMSVTFTLDDDIDISRGNMIVKAEQPPQVKLDLDIMICWMSEKKLQSNRKYLLRHTTNDVRCIIKEVKFKVNINTLEKMNDEKVIELNDIACISIRTTNPVIFDSYAKNRTTGSVILIDETSNTTVGAGMIM